MSKKAKRERTGTFTDLVASAAAGRAAREALERYRAIKGAGGTT